MIKRSDPSSTYNLLVHPLHPPSPPSHILNPYPSYGLCHPRSPSPPPKPQFEELPPSHIPHLRRKPALLRQTPNPPQQKLHLAIRSTRRVLRHHCNDNISAPFLFLLLSTDGPPPPMIIIPPPPSPPPKRRKRRKRMRNEKKQNSLCPANATSTHVNPLSVRVVPKTPLPANVPRLPSS